MNELSSIDNDTAIEIAPATDRLELHRTVSETEASAMLMQLMATAGWDADAARISAALPHEPHEYDGWDLIDSLIALHIPIAHAKKKSASLLQLDRPGILVFESGAFAIVPANASLGERASVKKPIGTEKSGATLYQVAHSQETEPVKGVQSATALFSGLRPHIGALLFASLVINLTGLVTPLFVMVIYNRIIPAGADHVLLGLAVGILLAVLTEIVMRRMRSKTMISLGAQLEHRLGLSLLHKLMAFPLASLMQSSVNQQRTRLRQFEGIREAMVGPLVQVGLDLPFIAIFCAMLFIIAPPIGWIAVIAALMQIGFLFLVAPALRRNETSASEAQADFRSITETIVTGQSHIRRSGEASHWKQAFRSKLEAGFASTMRAQFWMEVAAHCSQSIVLLAGLSAGFLATLMAIEGSLSVGGLVAVLVVIWRFLSPVQSIARAAGQALAVAKSLKLVDAVLSLPTERYRGADPSFGAEVTGPIVFDQVSLRFPGASTSAVAGVSFRASPGEITLLTGAALSGKSLCAELVAGLRAPQNGHVKINGVDVRQIPVDDLRRSISYCQQEPEFLYGTIRQNFRLARPGISDFEIETALAEAGALASVRDLPHRLDTRLKAETLARLPHGLLQSLSIARTIARPNPIYIFDQPCEGLDPENAALVRAAIKRRGLTGTVLLISTSALDFEIADRFVVFDRGRLVLNDKGKSGRTKAASIMKLPAITAPHAGPRP